MHKLLYSGCMIENVLMSGFIWFSSLSPIEIPSGSAAMNAGRISGDKWGTRNWTFLLGWKETFVECNLNFAIFSANTIDFFESFEINWECVEMNDIIGNSESTAWNARSRASGSRTGRVVTVLITNRASIWDSPEAVSYPCSSNNPCDIHFHDIILFYLSLVGGCRQSSTVVFGWRDELPTGAMHLISSFFTTDCRNYVRRMIESKTEHLEIV